MTKTGHLVVLAATVLIGLIAAAASALVVLLTDAPPIALHRVSDESHNVDLLVLRWSTGWYIQRHPQGSLDAVWAGPVNRSANQVGIDQDAIDAGLLRSEFTTLGQGCFGWPRPFASYTEILDFSTNRVVIHGGVGLEKKGTFELPPGLPLSSVGTSSSKLAIPLTLSWINLLINLLLYAGILYISFHVIRIVCMCLVRKSRKSSGLCPNCGYNLAYAVTGCPECGWGVRERVN